MCCCNETPSWSWKLDLFEFANFYDPAYYLFWQTAMTTNTVCVIYHNTYISGGAKL